MNVHTLGFHKTVLTLYNETSRCREHGKKKNWIINKGIMAIYTKGTKSNQKKKKNNIQIIRPRDSCGASWSYSLWLERPARWRPGQPNSNSSCLMHLIHKHQKQIHIYQKIGQFSYFLKILFESVCLLQ